MVLCTSQIEIASSPENVREVFLDFPKWHEWDPAFIKSVQPVSKERAADLVKGDKLQVALQGMKFSPEVLENSDRHFQWRGSLPGIFTGDHSFRFEPSKTTPGSTTFTNEEHFSGALSVFYLLPFMHVQENQVKNFEKFNESLKRAVESRK